MTILPNEKIANCIATPAIQSNSKNPGKEKKLHRTISKTDRQKTGIKKMDPRGKYFSTTIPAIRGSKSLKKGEVFQTLISFTLFIFLNG